ncbi:hypothetical protein KW842_17880 [Duganella sp. sic0402]|uniref:hypothetical protein n=1 Tax=Duganella sp. sic0402 TaxID=2854786 RepID=UPI001C44BBD7|nr:hypothetical protein [Duganella sp. sic0402]MBV7537641.1 hypothetical protein [Duganella sp. sic0402]
MQTLIAALLITPALTAPTAQLETLENPPATVLSDEVIKKAVRETIAEDAHPAPEKRPGGGVIRADAISARMSAAFDQAKVPDCLHEDALKHQPAHIGPVKVVGPYSLPWIVAAVVRGKCR